MSEERTHASGPSIAGTGAVVNKMAIDRLALDAVYEVAKSFSTAADPIEVVPNILNVLSSFLDLRHGVLALLSEPDGTAASGVTNPYRIAATAFAVHDTEDVNDIMSDRIAKVVFRSGVPLIAFDLADEYGEEAVPERLRGEPQTVVAVPLRDPDQTHFVIGVLAAYRCHNTNISALPEVDVRVLTMVASLLEQALRFRRRIARDRARAQEDTRRLLQTFRGQLKPVNTPISLDGIIGDSPAILDVIEQVKRVATKQTPVLLRGESGTGKELFARAVHSQSNRSNGPFVRVNCAALSETLLESELFGHEKGAFTGATALKKGRFELADGGTLFLDEIGDISPSFQTKLLRILQEGEFERVGGTKTIKANVRIVAATNRDLEDAVAQGEFRADLYFRICVVPIVLPPLRDRAGDIRPLAQVFLDQFNKTNGTKVRFAPDAFDVICKCQFPGNVRELENCVNRAASLSDGEVVLANELACRQNACLSADLARLKEGASPVGGLAIGRTVTPSVDTKTPARNAHSFSEPPAVYTPAEPGRRKTATTAKDELIAAMEEAGWVKAKAARLLGMTPRQIGYALQKHGVEVRKI
ncbi:nif-specific transcriptional activator NifA [Cognatiyoonia sp. IB215182]|uniref:nif-specific transcriptional activator NifA n=1 Tax=Cognatiyoonia sp. IB215182 TaxID=3097353 RepID=UPI002A13CD68|nr:nif-specific transcriptional activator NifA [Cognatiyoonia sp. IB215182]MDX8355461.1 nif-specific transcriptional activator NifA [Cognatiyoonia sp. IB215182]